VSHDILYFSSYIDFSNIPTPTPVTGELLNIPIPLSHNSNLAEVLASAKVTALFLTLAGIKNPANISRVNITISDFPLFKQETKIKDMMQAIHVALEKIKISGTDNKISIAIRAIFKYLFLVKSAIEKRSGMYKTK
jgi:hypothetical protein